MKIFILLKFLAHISHNKTAHGLQMFALCTAAQLSES